MTEYPKAKEFTVSEVVTVYVGFDKKRYSLHRELICRESKYFTACFATKNFAESQTREVFLLDQDAAAFDVLVNWFYHKKLYLEDQTMYGSKPIATHFKAYFLADMLMIQSLKNKIMDELRRVLGRTMLNTESVESCFGDNERKNDQPLHKYLIDQLAYNLLTKPEVYFNSMETGSDLLEETFVRDRGDIVWSIMHKHLEFAQAQKAGEIITDPSKLVECVYHEHSDEDECKAAVDAIRQKKNEEMEASIIKMVMKRQEARAERRFRPNR